MIKAYARDQIVSVEKRRTKLVPGLRVSHKSYVSSRGMVVSVVEDTVTVLWTTPPAGESFRSFAMPIVRRVFPQSFAQSIVKVQPMTTPVESIFYCDYTYNSGSLGEK